MGIVRVERVGGFAGFGGQNLRSEGEIDLAKLAPDDRVSTERLFSGRKGARPAVADGLRYRLTRADGKTIEAPESAVPQAIRDCVQDRLK